MTDSSVIQAFRNDQTQSYVAAAAGALVVYDQVLTFSQEVDLIWNRQWSFMTALYLIDRYSGSLSVIGYTVWSILVNWTYSGYVNMCLAVNWTQSIFILAMQAILVIRVYALFNQSKKVLLFLTTFYALRATAALVIVAVLYNNRAIHESVIFVGPALGNVAQIVNINSPAILLTVGRNGTILYVVFDTILLFFALWAFLRHILEAKALDGGWSINVLVRTLVTYHLVYFVFFQTWMVITLAEDITGGTPQGNNSLIFFTALAVVAGPAWSPAFVKPRTKRDSKVGLWTVK